MKRATWPVWTALAAIILLSLVDLGLNLLSFIPILGGWAETMSELVIETIQGLLAGFIALYAVSR